MNCRPYIANAFSDPAHQDVMVDSIEELFQIEINHPAEALGDKALSRHDRLMRQMPRLETFFALYPNSDANSKEGKRMFYHTTIDENRSPKTFGPSHAEEPAATPAE